MAWTPATSPTYAFRGLLSKPEQRFTLASDGLLVETGHQRVAIRYAEFTRAHLYQVDLTEVGPVDRCDLRARGRTVRLQSAHVAGPARLQDRRSAYEPFVWQLVREIAAANPDVRIEAGTAGSTRLGWQVTLVVLLISLLGGIALLVSGEWDGLGLVIMALSAAPRGLAMLAEKPSSQIGVSQVALSRGYGDLLG